MVTRAFSSHCRLGFLWSRVALSALVTTMPLVSTSQATPTLHDTGQWSEYGSDWRVPADSLSYAIHMALTRGEGSPHSYVLWWNGSSPDAFGGRAMGWSPLTDDCEDFPDTNFTSITVSPTVVNEFCSGHTSLADGRLFIAGGNDSVNNTAGGRYARIWRPGATQNSSNWTNADSMQESRWYPMTVPLADGKVLLLNGLQNEHHVIFGGRLDGTIPSQAVADSVRIFAPEPGGQWIPSAIPDSTTDIPMPHRPLWREFHSVAGVESGVWGDLQVYFGGKNSSGTPVQDTWLLRRDQNVTGADFSYKWEKGPLTGAGLPPPRSQHSAVGARGADEMYVFGGLDSNNTALGDLWQLYWNSVDRKYEWQTPSDSGAAPSARYGHAAFYDEIPGPGSALRRIILFGGVDAVGHAPSDTCVYEMRINLSSVAWTKMTEVDLGQGRPSARFGHAMDVDRAYSYEKNLVGGGSLKGHVAALFGGQTGSTTYSGELWLLWLFDDGRFGWEKRDSIGGSPPSARTHASVLFDGFEERDVEDVHPGRVHVFGGENGSPLAPIDNDQYEFDVWAKHPAWYKWAPSGAKASGHTAYQQRGFASARTAEVYDPDMNAWTTHGDATLFQPGFGPGILTPRHSGEAGRVFGMGIDNKAYYLDVDSISSPGWTPYPYGDLGFSTEPMVMYRPGKIMTATGIDSSHYAGGPSSFVSRTMTFDTEKPDSAWKPAAPYALSGSLTPRRFDNMVLMPDGKVIAIGGLRAFKQEAYAYTTHHPQIWDPNGAGGMGAWTDSSQLATQDRIRDYHSTAILLPDARILSAGGNKHPDGYYADLYSPPYLFNGDALATRPTLVATTSRWRYNQAVTFAVSGDTLVRNACLIRAPSTTHAFDQSQRYVPLTLASSAVRYDGKRQYFLTAPPDSFTAPPGDYMLFASDSFGVPSVAQWVRVGPVESGQFDTTAPDSFSINIAFVGCTSVGVDWTAPGNNGSTGTALDYDIRYSTSPINATNISSATPISGVSIPQLAGSVQSGSVSGLSQCTWYYFGGNARDGAGNWSLVGHGKQKTPCGFCEDPGEAMHRASESSTGMRNQRGGPALLGGLKGFAVPAELGSEGTTLRLVAEFEKGLTSKWRLNYEDFAADTALLSSTHAQLVVQDPLVDGWQTRSTFAPSVGHLAVRSLAKDGRIIFPAGASLLAAEVSPVGFHCEQATHSRLGDLLGSSSSLDSVSIEAAQNDTLELVYAPDSTSEGGEDCFLHVLVPAGAEETHARSLRPSPLVLDLPVSFALYPARPNPFSHQTTIRFDLPRPARVQIELFDVQGRRVATLANQSREAGRHSITWDGSTNNGGKAAAGIYLCRMRAGEFTAEKRISLLP